MRLSRVLSALVCLAGATGCATFLTEMTTALDVNPLALERALTQPVDARAEQSAHEAWQQDERAGALRANDPRQPALVTIMQRLVRVSHKPGLTPVIGIVNDPAINAAVDASGYVRVNRGLLDFTRSDDALASVLAHELGHVDAGHIRRSMLSSVVTQLAAYGAAKVARGETADQVIATVAAAIGPAYSRQHEREADVLGVVYAHRAGYNPRALDEVFTEIARASEQQQLGLARQLRQSYNQFAVAVNRYETLRDERSARQAAYAQQQYLRARQQYVHAAQVMAPLFRSHPLTEERRATVLAVTDFLEGKRAMQDLPPYAQTVIHTLATVEARQPRPSEGRDQAAAPGVRPSTARAPRANICPVDGQRFSPYVKECPQHHVLLRPES